MLYSDFRTQIQTGDLLAWRGTGLLGHTIRRWTGESYAHVGLAFCVYGRVLVAEAREGRGVSVRALSRNLPFHHIASGVLFDEATIGALIERFDSPYSYFDAARAGIGLATKRDHAWQCAEYASDLLIKAGRLKENHSSANTPGKLVATMLATGGQLKQLN